MVMQPSRTTWDLKHSAVIARDVTAGGKMPHSTYRNTGYDCTELRGTGTIGIVFVWDELSWKYSNGKEAIEGTERTNKEQRRPNNSLQRCYGGKIQTMPAASIH